MKYIKYIVWVISFWKKCFVPKQPKIQYPSNWNFSVLCLFGFGLVWFWQLYHTSTFKLTINVFLSRTSSFTEAKARSYGTISAFCLTDTRRTEWRTKSEISSSSGATCTWRLSMAERWCWCCSGKMQPGWASSAASGRGMQASCQHQQPGFWGDSFTCWLQ